MLDNLRLSLKLPAAFAVLAFAFLLSATLSVVQLDRIDEAGSNTDRIQRGIMAAALMNEEMLQQISAMRSMLLRPTQQQPVDFATARQRFKEQEKVASEIIRDPEQKKRLAAISAAADAWYVQAGEPQIRLASDPATRDKAMEIVATGMSSKLYGVFREESEAFRQRQKTLLAQRASEEAAAQANARYIAFISAGFAVIFAGLMGWFSSRSIAQPATALARTMTALAKGDNTVVVPSSERGDEIGDMAKAVLVFKGAAIAKSRLEAEGAEQRQRAESERARNESERAAAAAELAGVMEDVADALNGLAKGDLTFRLARLPGDYSRIETDFNAALTGLQETMRGIAATAHTIHTGTGEIGHAADDLSRRTEQQAASLEETAAALDEITATVKKTAEGSKHAREVVESAREDAQKSGLVVQEAVTAMSAIEASSKEISNIIGVIDEIAFQTNLLALNAGVEAARAGDAGKGFAVVASEVRALAQRSAEAAKEIKTLISASSTHVASGVTLVSETGKALTRIVAQVSEIHAVVGEMAASANEQATALNEVNSAVNQMDQVTQQNAAMVEETTAASHSLAGEADDLTRRISGFQVGASQPAPVRRAAAKPAPRPAPAPRSAPATRGNLALAAKPAEDAWEEF
jgi:methyl-accepting chemotaxis protein